MKAHARVMPDLTWPPGRRRSGDRLGSVTRTGSADTRLVLLRGNSASGKSRLARSIRAARPRGIAIVGQDQLRRDILHVNEKPGNLTVGYLDLSARYALDHGLHRTSTHHQAAGRRLTPRMR